MAPSVVRDAKDFSRGLFVSSWDISAVEIRTAKSPNIIAIVVSIVVYKSALQCTVEYPLAIPVTGRVTRGVTGGVLPLG